MGASCCELVSRWLLITVNNYCVALFTCRHRLESTDEDASGPVGSLRINGSQVESKVGHVIVSMTLATTVKEMLKEAIKKFALQVSEGIVR